MCWSALIWELLLGWVRQFHATLWSHGPCFAQISASTGVWWGHGTRYFEHLITEVSKTKQINQRIAILYDFFSYFFHIFYSYAKCGFRPAGIPQCFSVWEGSINILTERVLFTFGFSTFVNTGVLANASPCRHVLCLLPGIKCHQAKESYTRRVAVMTSDSTVPAMGTLTKAKPRDWQGERWSQGLTGKVLLFSCTARFVFSS